MNIKSTKLPVLYKKNSFITVMVNNRPFTLISSDPLFEEAVLAYKNEDYSLLSDIVNRPKAIERYSDGNIRVFDGIITYKGKQVHNYVVTKIFELMDDGFNINPLVKFLDNLMTNPNIDVQTDLLQFLEVNEMAITEDGGFLAYKLTKSDGTPYYNDDGVTKYYVGAVLEMDRNTISTERHECYGPGYYFGNKGYWNGSFDDQNRYTGDGKMFIVKIMPEWVVSIPSSEATTKGRAYKMEVVGEYETVRELIHKESVVNVEYEDGIEDREFEDSEFFNQKIEEDIQINEYLNSLKSKNSMPVVTKSTKQSPRRDKNGRFAKKNSPVRDSKGRFVKKV